MLQCQPIQKFHGDERFAVLVVDFVDGADVGMIQRGRSFGLAFEAIQGLWVLRYVVRQELERNKSSELQVLGLVNHTHPAPAEFLDDAVMRSGLADHWGRSYVRGSGKSM
jgi:hypothetical protein